MQTSSQVRRTTIGAESWQPCVTSNGRMLADGSEAVTLKAGDVASFAKGLDSVWTILEPLEKFTVVSG
jgi:uncharacterized cupin superfamily protein